METTMKTKARKVTGSATNPMAVSSTSASIGWWRSMHANGFDESAVAELRSVLGKLNMLGESQWKRAAGGDAASAIGIALRMQLKGAQQRDFDLGMTALAICAAVGDVSACLVMAHILRRLPQAGKMEAKIATSWLVKAFGTIVSRRHRRANRGAMGGSR